MSDQLRDAARRVVEAWDREFGTAEDAKAFEATIEALRAALTETGEADPQWRYYAETFCGLRWRFSDHKGGEYLDTGGQFPVWKAAETTEREAIVHCGAFRTDADGNRLEGPGK